MDGGGGRACVRPSICVCVWRAGGITNIRCNVGFFLIFFLTTGLRLIAIVFESKVLFGYHIIHNDHGHVLCQIL